LKLTDTNARFAILNFHLGRIGTQLYLICSKNVFKLRVKV